MSKTICECLCCICKRLENIEKQQAIIIDMLINIQKSLKCECNCKCKNDNQDENI